MNRFFLIPAVIFAVAIIGCGGSAIGIKGIAEREIDRPRLPSRVKIDPRAYNFYINGSIFETMGDYYMAKDQYACALEIIPQSSFIRYSYASTLANLKEFRNSLNEAASISDKDVDAWLLIGNDYRSLAIYDSSLIAYQNALQIDSNIPSVYYFIGAYYQQENNLDSVIWAYQHIARLMQDYKAFQQLADFQLKAGHINQARNSYLQSLDIDSTAGNIRSFLALSAIYEETGDKEKAIEFIKAAERREPNDIMILRRLLGFYEEDGQIARAIETVQRIIPLEPTDKNFVRRLGVLYYRADSLNLADSIFTSLIDDGDDQLVNHYYAGQISFKRDDFNQAIEHFSKLTMEADTVLDGWMNLAKVYYAQDSLGLTINTYVAGLSHMQNLDDSLVLIYSLAAARERQDSIDQAIDLFETVLKHQPDNGQALNYLGYMLADRGMRLDYAKQLILRALDIEPLNGAYIDSYGWVLYRMGEYRTALKVLLQALQYINTDPVVYEHVGDAYQALGDFKKAREYWDKAFELDPDSDSLKGKLYQ